VCACYTEDALSYHVGSRFSTKNEDNDDWAEGSCAKKRKSGWWFKHCSECDLNGPYYKVS